MKINKPDYSELRAKHANNPEVLDLIDIIDAQHTLLENQSLRLENCDKFTSDIGKTLNAIDAQHAELEATGRCPTCKQLRLRHG